MSSHGDEDTLAAKGYRGGMVVRFLIAAAVILFLFLWVRAALDVFRRVDLGMGAKASWILIMLLLPFIGLLVYTMLRPSDTQIAQRALR
jgi:Phospholipase_D-nuclease N-terminal